MAFLLSFAAKIKPAIVARTPTTTPQPIQSISELPNYPGGMGAHEPSFRNVPSPHMLTHTLPSGMVPGPHFSVKLTLGSAKVGVKEKLKKVKRNNKILNLLVSTSENEDRRGI